MWRKYKRWLHVAGLRSYRKSIGFSEFLDEKKSEKMLKRSITVRGNVKIYGRESLGMTSVNERRRWPWKQMRERERRRSGEKEKDCLFFKIRLQFILSI